MLPFIGLARSLGFGYVDVSQDSIKKYFHLFQSIYFKSPLSKTWHLRPIAPPEYAAVDISSFLLLLQIFQKYQECQQRVFQLEQELGQRAAQQDALAEEKIRLLREIAKLKAGRGTYDTTDASNVRYIKIETPINDVTMTRDRG
jgi:hypothetical protein